MVAPYPTVDNSAINPEAERIMEAVIEIVRSIRNVRAEHKVEPSRWIEARVYSGELTTALAMHAASIETLARVKPVSFQESQAASDTSDNSFVMVLKETEVVIPMESMVDMTAERERLSKEIEQVGMEIGRLETRLSDQAFLSKAPEAVIEKERGRLAERKDRLERLRQELDRLG
jgi:valyl-tRNA synthetase